jgi:integrase
MAKRGNQEGSIHKRSDGRWVGVLHLGYIDGKRQRKYIYGKTQRDVQAQLTAARAAQQQGQRPTSGRLTVAQYLSRWLTDSVQPSVRPRTYASYAQLVRLHLAPGLGRTQLAQLQPHDVQTFMNRKLASGLSPRTVQYLHAILRRALGQALKWGLVHRNVAKLVDPPRVRRPEIHPLTPEQARAFLDAARGDRLEALYSVALAIGLRQGEALGLRWEHIDLDGGELRVRVALQRIAGKLQLVEPKTRQSRRTIPLPQVAVNALRAHRVSQLEERLLAGDRWVDTGLVFCTPKGTPLDARNVTRRFQKLLKQTDLPHQRFHDLRHTCATLLLVQGVPPRVVMEILGHSQISLTMDTYTHVVPALKREAASRMDALLGAKEG